MSNEEKTCKHCGRIITDPNNKTGFCPKCSKQGGLLGAGWLLCIGVGLAKYGPKAKNTISKVVKKIV